MAIKYRKYIVIIIITLINVIGCASIKYKTISFTEFISKSDNNDDLDLYYQEFGSGDPIIFIHGFGANLFTWRHLIPPLSENYHLIMIDLKGSGKSPKTFDEKYSIYDHAYHVYQFIKRKDLKNLTIVGHSFGGSVSLAISLYIRERDPNRLRKLILIDSIAYDQELPVYLKILKTPFLGKLILYTFPDRFKVKSVLKAAYYDDKKITDKAISFYSQQFKTHGYTHSIIQTARQLIPTDPNEFINEYRKIETPTLIIWGREDKLIPLSIGERLNEEIPNSKFFIIDQCGHIPHEEDPNNTLQIIVDFLNAT